MVQIDGKYEHTESIGFVEMLVARGMPEDKAKLADTDRELEIKLDGKKINICYGTGTRVHSLELDKEVEEPGRGDEILKTTATLNGDVLAIESKLPNGNTNRRDMIFSDSGVEVRFQSREGLQAKRIYKRV